MDIWRGMSYVRNLKLFWFKTLTFFSSKHVRPIFGVAYQLPDGTIEDEAETLGLTGQFTKNAASRKKNLQPI